MRKGNNTAWLTRENSDGSEKTILASTGQIAPCPSSEVSDLPVTDISDVPLPRSPEHVPVAIAAPAAENVSETTGNDTKESPAPSNVSVRRSARIRARKEAEPEVY